MKPIPLALIGLYLGLLACTNANTPKNGAVTDTSSSASPAISDSIPRFTVDDYPVTDSMLGSDSNAREIKNGALRSVDKAWFGNDSLNQTLVIELYTDLHRMTSFHFYNNNIPDALITRMEFSNENGDTVSLADVLKSFKGFIPQANKISSRYFTTTKGLQLGDNFEKAVAIYGQPDQTETTNGTTVYRWAFVGDNIYDGKTDLKGKPLAKDSYGHEATLFFQNNKLIAAILFNDIP